ncbi:MAG: DivIVA domain-containing protein, partial [Acidimicrobiales bacterium]
MQLRPEEIERKKFPVVRKGYDPDAVTSFLRDVATLHYEVVRAEAEARRAVEDAQRTAQRAEQELAGASVQSVGFDKIGRQVATILSSAADAAED